MAPLMLGALAAGGAPLHAQAPPEAPPNAARIAMVIHGGAGTIRRQDMTPARDSAYRAALREALGRGYAVIKRGGTSLDAVQAAINFMEDSPLFNAGRGAVLTSTGTVEMDAAIMDGGSGKAGAVAGVGHIKNPITLARLVMERTPHVMLAGAGAEAFARSQGVAMMPQSYFIIDRRRNELERDKQARTAHQHHGTVGAVALDSHGHLAAGTSTGGTSDKLPGRIGDSPIIGAGTYADDASCAVSATGAGEYFIRNVVAHDICARVLYKGVPLAQAADEVIMHKLVALGGGGGVIALDRQGHMAAPFNTEGMYRAWVDTAGNVTVKIYRDE